VSLTRSDQSNWGKASVARKEKEGKTAGGKRWHDGLLKANKSDDLLGWSLFFQAASKYLDRGKKGKETTITKERKEGKKER